MKYEIVSGRKIPVVDRLYADDPIDCPYCFREHHHGTADGHRLTHCATNAQKHLVIVGDEEVDYRNGYIIVTEYATKKRPAKWNRTSKKK